MSSTVLLVGDGHVLDSAAPASRVLLPNGTSVSVRDFTRLDVATLAHIASTDAPHLIAIGDGPLGSGTHPAQFSLNAMLGMRDVGTLRKPADVTYGWESAESHIRTFLEMTAGWDGEIAAAVRAALAQHIGYPLPAPYVAPKAHRAPLCTAS